MLKRGFLLLRAIQVKVLIAENWRRVRERWTISVVASLLIVFCSVVELYYQRCQLHLQSIQLNLQTRDIAQLKLQHEELLRSAVRPHVALESSGFYMAALAKNGEWRIPDSSIATKSPAGWEDYQFWSAPLLRNYGNGTAIDVALIWTDASGNQSAPGRLDTHQVLPNATANVLSIPEFIIASESELVVGTLSVQYADVRGNRLQIDRPFELTRISGIKPSDFCVFKLTCPSVDAVARLVL